VTRVHQEDFSTEQPEAQAAPRVPLAHGDQERPKDSGLSPRQGPQASERLTGPDGSNPSPLAIERLRVRREFLYVAEGYAERRRLVVIQARRRGMPRDSAGVGFTATKKVGGSVVRNRARRRLREAVRLLLPGLGVAGVDYVVVARQETGTTPWPRLLDDIEKALVSLRRRFISGDHAPTSGVGPTPPPARA
jgi:ribonuclease P protein component